ncbi:ER glycosyl hydrolase [Aspergillus campestris IBT 28561]|uniref:gamma-glutamylcyclotransferase n=1 Tax=Aspergillus campestris (strain IBT 28561) TaxID=1392248 RepID=A0A2I1CSP4_ASPC2|nr:ER glycosyl hydrolase [Aspergillus campestris IBT 28561]PKY00645.1 ER glycosyl hydrolase [Aspergillus campestris IBT 28561]
MHLKETEPSPGSITAPEDLQSNLNITLTHKPTTTVSSSTPNEQQQQQPPNKSRRPLYFAYGSNLSPTQMRHRCTQNPTRSSHPVAIATLPHWRWLICESGYANVVPPPSLRIGKQLSGGDKVPVSGEEDAVFGVLYDMDVGDERLLDGFEGVDRCAPVSREGGRVPLRVRPREQGSGDYNKWVVGARVVRWLDGGYQRGLIGDGDGEGEDGEGEGGEVMTLVYVDEERVKCGPPYKEYIARMNRAISEAETLGFPAKWAEEVMRPYIPRE